MYYLLRSPYPHPQDKLTLIPALYVAAWWGDRPGHIGHPLANGVKPRLISKAELARYTARRPHHHYTVIPITCPDDLPPDLTPAQISNAHVLGVQNAK